MSVNGIFDLCNVGDYFGLIVILCDVLEIVEFEEVFEIYVYIVVYDFGGLLRYLLNFFELVVVQNFDDDFVKSSFEVVWKLQGIVEEFMEILSLVWGCLGLCLGGLFLQFGLVDCEFLDIWLLIY